MEIDTVSNRPEVSADDRGTIKKSVAVTPEEAVRDATVDFNFWLRFLLRYLQRRRLRFRAWYAKETGERDWYKFPKWVKFFLFFPWLITLLLRLVIRRSYGPDGFEKKSYNANAHIFGEKIKKFLPASLKDRLEEFAKGGGEPFLIVRGVFSRRYPQLLSLARRLDSDPNDRSRKIVGEAANKLLEERRYNLIASALIAAADAKHCRKLEKHPVYRDFITDIASEKNQFVEGRDMHLRYRTATPENAPAASGSGKAARVVLFACIENPIAAPIYLIRADKVVSQLSEKVRSLLLDANFNFFDNWDPDTFVRERQKQKRILYDGPSESDPWLSFDANRLDTTYTKTTPAHLSAVVELMESIRKTAATDAREIVLRRGDALIVDNYRALTCRQEHGYANLVFKPTAFGRPRIRWLRVYYGFPK
jgi:hypothetical protein